MAIKKRNDGRRGGRDERFGKSFDRSGSRSRDDRNGGSGRDGGRVPGAFGKSAATKRSGKNHHADWNRKNRSQQESNILDTRPEKRGNISSERYREDRRVPRQDAYVPAGFEAGSENVLAGRNPVMEALKSGRGINKILMTKDAEGSALKIAAKARDLGVVIQYTDRKALDRAAGPGVHHQGAVAYVTDFEYCQVEDILKIAKDKGEDPFIIVLDGLEDPHNFGAIMRSVDVSGAHGIIISKHRAVPVTATVEKASAGAAEYVPVARVTNIASAVEQLKEAGVWVAAADMDGDSLYDAPLDGPIALVIGNEGKGISRIVMDKSDICVSIPMMGKVNSLNASNAAAILMYEVVRRRMR